MRSSASRCARRAGWSCLCWPRGTLSVGFPRSTGGTRSEPSRAAGSRSREDLIFAAPRRAGGVSSTVNATRDGSESTDNTDARIAPVHVSSSPESVDRRIRESVSEIRANPCRIRAESVRIRGESVVFHGIRGSSIRFREAIAGVFFWRLANPWKSVEFSAPVEIRGVSYETVSSGFLMMSPV